MTPVAATAVQTVAALRLDAIALDDSPRVRATIDPAVVAVYAERMAAGDVFPPIIVFFDGAGYHLADGWHRLRATRGRGAVEIVAEIRLGSARDALWFALGAQRAHGHRLTDADVRLAVRLACDTWPDLSAATIADHVGCDRSYVARERQQHRQHVTNHQLAARVRGRDGKRYPASLEARRALRQAAVPLLEAGESVEDVCRATGLGHGTVATMRREITITPPPLPPTSDRSPAAAAARIDRIRALAADGNAPSQIAALTGLTEKHVRESIVRHAIVAPANTVLGRGSRRPDSTRIVEQMVFQAEHLCGDTNLIDFHKLPVAMLPQWITTLKHARRDLARFINRLQQQEQPHE